MCQTFSLSSFIVVPLRPNTHTFWVSALADMSMYSHLMTGEKGIVVTLSQWRFNTEI